MRSKVSMKCREDREEDLSDEIDSEARGETSDIVSGHRRAWRESKSRELSCSNFSDESDDDGSYHSRPREDTSRLIVKIKRLRTAIRKFVESDLPDPVDYQSPSMRIFVSFYL